MRGHARQQFWRLCHGQRNLVFSINDFDEVYVGPWEWDLKRLAASATVAAKVLGADQTESEDAARQCVRSYRKHIRRYAKMRHLEVWYDRIDERAILEHLTPKSRRIAKKIMGKARHRGHITTLDKLTERVKGQHRLIEDVPLIVRETHTTGGTPVKVALDRFLRVYIDSLSYHRKVFLSRYQIIDATRKVVGVGSVGTECWILLLQGLHEDDPLFLQIRKPINPFWRPMLTSSCLSSSRVTGWCSASVSPRVHRISFWVGARSTKTVLTFASLPT